MRRTLLVLCPILLTAQTAPLPPDKAVQAGFQAMGEGRYLAAHDLFRSAAFDADGQVLDESAFQNWQQFGTAVTGELPLDTMYARKGVAPPDAAMTAQVRTATARDAIAEIVARARATRVVILNEAHYSPRDRAFAWEVARALRPLGYSYLAAETLDNNPTTDRPRATQRLATDGFVRRSTGTYSEDPVFAAYLRQAVALGYRPVAYEITRAQRVNGSDIATREQAQSDNLVAAIFARDPNAKVLIHVGHGHVAEELVDRGGNQVMWMAGRLKRATGIDPLTIDQTTLTDLMPPARDAYPLAAAKVGRRSGVLFAGERPLIVGRWGNAVDLQVVHPPRAYRHGRPTWLAALGGRPVAIPATLLPATGERLVQAFAAAAPTDAVPLDQVLVRAGRPAPRMMLPAGRVRWATQDR